VLNERIGQYRITERLGHGGMGEIFAARDEKLNRTVAVKFIANPRLDSDSSRRLFLREARAAAALDHPFICTVHDVLEHNGQPVIVMERVEGETLQERLSHGSLPVAQIVQYATEIAEALGAAHARGVVHRDIKTANIMLMPNGHLKVMDFGLALMLSISPEEQTAHFSEELASKVAGTLPYMAPEVLGGENATSSADLYALGVVMYEMATGRRPFTGRTDALLVSDILHEPAPPPRQLNPAVPRAVEDLILQLLAKQPERRPPSAGEVIARLRAISEPHKPKPEQSLAVLPFRALTADPDSAHLGVALADAITSELALVRSLLVRPTAAILRYQDANDPIAAGRELGVDAVVAGTFQRAGSRLRVTVQLIRISEERPLWSTKVDATLDDLLAMQDQVSKKIVEALQLELSPADAQRFANRVQVTGDVLDLYLKGRVTLLSESLIGANTAIELFEKAREIDPRNPLPWLGLADAYIRLGFTYDPEAGWYERAKEMCDRALRLDPRIPEGRYIGARLAWTPQAGFDHEHAIRELVGALAERPNLSEGFDWLAVILFHLGLLKESRAQIKRALAINPEDGLALSHLPTLDLLEGDYRAALENAQRAQAKAESSWTAYSIALAQIHNEEIDAAERTLDQALRKFPAMVLFHSARSILAALATEEEMARRHIARTEQNRKQFGHFHHAEFDIACALAVLGHGDEALDWLTSAMRNGFPCLPALENEPLLRSLRSRPRYRELVTEVRLQRDHYAEMFANLSRTISGF
jgi:serine/threonine protein kinase/Tfp pilus assembly protein PilF